MGVQPDYGLLGPKDGEEARAEALPAAPGALGGAGAAGPGAEDSGRRCPPPRLLLSPRAVEAAAAARAPGRARRQVSLRSAFSGLSRARVRCCGSAVAQSWARAPGLPVPKSCPLLRLLLLLLLAMLRL